MGYQAENEYTNPHYKGTFTGNQLIRFQPIQ